jgi:hypothetical protein
MSFENIQLPDFLLADLYKDCLVELENIKPVEEAVVANSSSKVIKSEPVSASKPLPFIGENKKKITIVVDEENTAFLNDNDQLFLTNVLKACNLSTGDIAIVNIYNRSVGYTTLQEELNPAFVLLFGVDPASIHLPFTIPQFQSQPYGDCTYLVSPALSDINQPTADGKMYKTKLWGNLQKMFPINK